MLLENIGYPGENSSYFRAKIDDMSIWGLESVLTSCLFQKKINPMTTTRISMPIISPPIKTGEVDFSGTIPHFGHFSVRAITFSEQLGQIFINFFYPCSGLAMI